MRKKCVRWWTKSVRAALIVAIAVVGASEQKADARLNAPTTLPLLAPDQFHYLGGFRLPRETVNGDSFAFGGETAAFNPANNSLFVVSRANRVAEVTIPAPVISDDVNKLPFASFLQPFYDPTEGRLGEVGSTGVSIDGLMVHGDRLIGSASIFYDAVNAQRISHFSHSVQLDKPSFSGWSRVWESGKTGFVSGFMSPIPVEWRTALGGAAATGQCCIPIVTRTSWGPASFAFDPSRVGSAAVDANPLLYYTGEHPTLGHWSGANSVYGATTMINGMTFIGGTRTALFIGRNGTGPYCYGNGTAIESLHGLPSPDGSHYCYDPTASDKGTHAYPYNFQMWAYDVAEFAAVKSGTKQPWEVMPYAVWPFELPTFEPRIRLGGVAYDPQNQRLYVTQLFADKDGYQSRPIMHVFEVGVAPAPAPVSGVTISADKPTPQLVDTPIAFSAVTTGGVAPYQYKWAVAAGSEWHTGTNWSPSNTFKWTPSKAGADYRVAVWVRSAWNTDDGGEASASMPYAVEPPPPPPPTPVATTPPSSSKVTGVALASDHASPVATGTKMRWTATPTGGGSGVQFKWLAHNGYNWLVYKDWSSDSTFDYQPGIAGTNKVGVWVRSGGNLKDAAEVSASSSSFSVVGPTMVTPLPIPQSSTKYLAVFIAPDRQAPQPAGSAVTWTAAAFGGTSAPMFKWLVYDGYGWVAQGSWTSSPTFTWKPSAPNAKYKVAVWVKSATNTADQSEATTTFEYEIRNGKP